MCTAFSLRQRMSEPSDAASASETAVRCPSASCTERQLTTRGSTSCWTLCRWAAKSACCRRKKIRNQRKNNISPQVKRCLFSEAVLCEEILPRFHWLNVFDYLRHFTQAHNMSTVTNELLFETLESLRICDTKNRRPYGFHCTTYCGHSSEDNYTYRRQVVLWSTTALTVAAWTATTTPGSYARYEGREEVIPKDEYVRLHQRLDRYGIEQPHPTRIF